MAFLRLISASEFLKMPWKNGKGVTRELGIYPPRFGVGLSSFEWRISIAAVPEDGPFSRFEGYDRQILVLEGHGMTLRHPTIGEEHSLKPLEPYAFSGDIETVGRLHAGPVEDFNVMTRQGAWQSRVEVLRAGTHTRESTKTCWVYIQAGMAVLEEPVLVASAPPHNPSGGKSAEQPMRIPAGAALMLAEAEGITFRLRLLEGSAAVLVWLERLEEGSFA
ncbi:MAG: HutD family protein [Myxococcota bacterium]